MLSSQQEKDISLGKTIYEQIKRLGSNTKVISMFSSKLVGLSFEKSPKNTTDKQWLRQA